MPKTQMTVQTTKSPEEAFAYLTDFAHHPEWRHDVLASELDAGTPGHAGAVYRQTVKLGRREDVSRVQLTEAVPARALAFRTLDDGPVCVHGHYALTPSDTGTQIVVDTTLEARGPLKLMAPVFASMLRRTNRRYTEQLTAALAA